MLTISAVDARTGITGDGAGRSSPLLFRTLASNLVDSTVLPDGRIAPPQTPSCMLQSFRSLPIVVRLFAVLTRGR